VWKNRGKMKAWQDAASLILAARHGQTYGRAVTPAVVSPRIPMIVQAGVYNEILSRKKLTNHSRLFSSRSVMISQSKYHCRHRLTSTLGFTISDYSIIWS